MTEVPVCQKSQHQPREKTIILFYHLKMGHSRHTRHPLASLADTLSLCWRTADPLAFMEFMGESQRPVCLNVTSVVQKDSPYYANRCPKEDSHQSLVGYTICSSVARSYLSMKPHFKLHRSPCESYCITEMAYKYFCMRFKSTLAFQWQEHILPQAFTLKQ